MDTTVEVSKSSGLLDPRTEFVSNSLLEKVVRTAPVSPMFLPINGEVLFYANEVKPIRYHQETGLGGSSGSGLALEYDFGTHSFIPLGKDGKPLPEYSRLSPEIILANVRASVNDRKVDSILFKMGFSESAFNVFRQEYFDYLLSKEYRLSAGELWYLAYCFNRGLGNDGLLMDTGIVFGENLQKAKGGLGLRLGTLASERDKGILREWYKGVTAS